MNGRARVRCARSGLEDSHDAEHDYNDYDGDDQAEDTAHGISLQDVSGYTSTHTMSPHNN